MALNQFIRELENLKAEFPLLRLEDLYRERSFGEQSLHYLKPKIEDVILKIDQALSVANDVSTTSLQSFISEIRSIISIIKQVIGSDQTRFYELKGHFEGQINEIYEKILSLWPEFRGLLTEKQLSSDIHKDDINYYKQKLEELTIELNKQQAKSSEDSKRLHELRTKLESEFNNFDKRIKETLTKGEFLVQEDIFKKQASVHKSLSNYWLVGMFVAIVILISVIIYIFNNFCFETTCLSICNLSSYNSICSDCGHQILIFELVKSIIFRLLIVSLSIYLLSFCIKNYNAQMHNFTINSHKQNSFAAALNLITKAETAEGKDKLIVEAAQTIFSHQKTGYGGKESEVQNLNMLTSLIDKINSR